MNIGIIEQNRDPNKRRENFEKSHPEVKLSYNATSHVYGPDKNPFWQILYITLYNPDSSKTIEEREKEYKEWFERYTDFDIIESSSTGRRWHPWGDEKNPEQYEESFEIKMRNEEDVY